MNGKNFKQVNKQEYSHNLEVQQIMFIMEKDMFFVLMNIQLLNNFEIKLLTYGQTRLKNINIFFYSIVLIFGTF